MLSLVNSINKVYDYIILPVFKGDFKLELPLSEKNFSFVEKIVKIKNFSGNKNEKLEIKMVDNDKVLELVLIGLGKKSEFLKNKYREKLFTTLKSIEKGSILIYLNGIGLVKETVETAQFSNYKFDKYFSEKKDKKKFVDIFSDDKSEFEEAESIAESVIITRSLVNEPANVMNPEELGKVAENLGEKYGFEVEILGKEKISELKMEAFLSVSRAAEVEPKLIIMRYSGDKAEPKVGIVGKGLTYDTGGLSLKPSSSMEHMKSDMGGAASVIGVMCAIARNNLKKNVVAVIAACENSIGGNAYRPGDIINTMAGKTIEVINTDAEGRLTLADAITYTLEKEGVEKIVDVATLTGAALVGLGTTTTAVVTNSDKDYRKLEKASVAADERVWRLPNFPEYKELIKSKVADLKNTGGRHAGTITAALFIEEFTKGVPWVHLDIAGTSWASSPYSYYAYGGTGQIVRTLYYFIKD